MTDNKGTEPSARQRSLPYPRFNLQQAERLARVAFDNGVRNCDQDRIAQAIGYKSAHNGSFVAHKASANQFGLITGRGQLFSVTDEWIRVFDEDDAKLFRAARQAAMLHPELYKKIIEAYKDRQFPPLDRFARELYLNQKYNIVQGAAKTAAETFIESAKYAGLFDANNYLRINNAEEDDGASGGLIDETPRAVSAGGLNLPRADRSVVARLADGQIAAMAFDASQHGGQAASEGTPTTNSGRITVTLPEGLRRIEVELENGKTAYLFLPGTLRPSDKDRLKGYINLTLDEKQRPTPQDEPVKGFAGDTLDNGT